MHLRKHIDTRLYHLMHRTGTKSILFIHTASQDSTGNLLTKPVAPVDFTTASADLIDPVACARQTSYQRGPVYWSTRESANVRYVVELHYLHLSCRIQNRQKHRDDKQ